MNENKLPKGWVECELKNISEIVRGVSYKKDDASNDEKLNSCLILRGGNIQDGKIVTDNNDLVFVDKSLIKEKQRIKKGDVIIVGSTGSKELIGKSGIAKMDYENVSFGAFLMLIRPNNLINKIYFDYFFLSYYYRTEIRNLAGGVNINNIRKEYIENLKIPLPPKAEQERMVEKLDALFGQLEILKTHLQTVPQLLKDFRQSVLNQAITGKLKIENGKLKVEDWMETTLGEISSVVRGGSPRPAGDPKFYGGDIPFVKVKDITKDSNKFLESYEYTITEAGLRKTRQLKKNTVLLTNSGATLGVPKITKFNITINDGVAAFLNLIKSTEDFLYYFLLTQTEKFRNIDKGAAQPNLNTDIIKNWKITLPPLSEQEEIVKKVESLLAKADAIEQKYFALKQEIDALPQSILAKAFRGELVPQLPTDGSAKDLLEEIKNLKP